MASEREPTFIVGIGASAGGVEALVELLRATPADTGFGFVVVTHAEAGRESQLAEILGRSTEMPVRQARDGEPVLADHVHIIPPGWNAALGGGALDLRPAPPGEQPRHPIDAFLGSLAADRGEHAIAVILSGAGSDGTLGVIAIKEAGGLTVAQTAGGSGPRHDAMPQSAIASGLVDLSLPVAAIPAKLVDYAAHFRTLAASFAAASEPEADGGRPALTVRQAREAVCEILRDRLGHDFGGYKESTFLRRVQRRMQVLQLSTLDAYVRRLRQDPDEATLLFRDLLIGVTRFFRDPEAFRALEELVIPRLFDGKGPGGTVRVWVPGCSTGEEVYSLAILLRERMDAMRPPPRVRIFATDIDEGALQVARVGRYPAALLDGVPEERRERFFTPDGETLTVTKRVRDLCVFSTHSVIRDPPFSRLDLISCRNLLIYLGPEQQEQVIPVFHFALRPGGFLFLGGSENVTRHADLFRPLDKKHRIFERRDHGNTLLTLPSFLRSVRSRPGAGDLRADPGAEGLALRRAVEGYVIERFAPPHVVVNREGDVVHYSPRTGRYLEPPVGHPSRNVLAQARKGLRFDLHTAVAEAVETRRTVRREGVTVEGANGTQQAVDLTVEPLAGRDGDPLFLILFGEAVAPLSAEEVVRRTQALRAPEERLEFELKGTRDRLQAMMEEYETALEELKAANEELVATNEELQSTNEELETNKEELQSVNEELHTVNSDLGVKLDDLNRANADLKNLFESTRIAVAFLDRQLVIRLFTPALADLFSLIPTDRGRPLADITGRAQYPDLHRDLRRVLDSGETVEQRVSRDDGKAHYLARLLPYRDGRGGVDGVTATFLDITSLVEGERQQRTLVDELNHRVRNMLTVVGAIASQTLEHTPSPEAFGPAFLGRVEALARAYGLVARERWGDVALEEAVREELEPVLDDDGARITLAGPEVMLRPKAAVPVGMVLHELVTNAVKYGSLSSPQGRLAVEWTIEDGPAGKRLVLRWTESGGPVPDSSGRKGFGTELIEREIRHDLRGEIALDLTPQGLRAVATSPWVGELFA